MEVSYRPGPSSKPRVFVGSSSESEEYAVATKRILEEKGTLSVTYWKDLPWAGSQTVLDTLTKAAGEDQFEFAVFVLSPDDVLMIRGDRGNVPRDNVIFEMGLFIGALGRDCVFLIAPDKADLKLPSDMGGVRTGSWVTGQQNTDSAVRSAASTFRSAIESMWAGRTMIRGGAGGRLAGSRTPDGDVTDVWLQAYRAGALEPLDSMQVEIDDLIVHGRWGPGVVTEVHPSSGVSRYLTIAFPAGTATLLSDNIARQIFKPQN